MVYQFKVSSTELSRFQLLIELDGTHTFADFHNCIQQACGYNSDQLASFFTQGARHGKQTEISLLDSKFHKPNSLCMTRTTIQSIINRKDQKMLYVFDFFADRLFYVELTQILMGKTRLEPSVIEQNGAAPSQLLEEEVMGQGPEVTKEEECLDYGDLDDYNEIFGEIEDLTGGV
ncbi:IS1096 element passenger TnpR family protein [Mangrovibacterium marinum]|uniref:PRiA4b ORF-3-like protein n=1 Tax=Mangrovibacterium marinum TaxID=1639118 RepID=A0A2T5C5X2_9BACT|nr:hypothetical protein [Mangrovibacterium marinum]PTN10281.1 pRiA4b ORF-3-like protein [Mangrovibacterium marinum]